MEETEPDVWLEVGGTPPFQEQAKPRSMRMDLGTVSLVQRGRMQATPNNRTIRRPATDYGSIVCVFWRLSRLRSCVFAARKQ